MTTTTVSGGQTSSGLVLNSTDRLTVLSGGTALGTTVNIGAIATLSSGGIASGTILHAQGLEQVLAGATVSGTVVSSGGSEALAGTATSTVISLGGTQTVLSGGTAIATAATDHGAQFVSGGTAISTVLTGEAEDVVSAGGVTRYSVLSNDSVETVGSGGLAVSTIVGAPGASIIEGAALYIFSGGTATGAVLSSGFLADAGVTSDTVVLSGGVEYVSAATLSAGGTAIGTVLDAGGTLVVQSGGVITGGVTFNGSGGFLDISGTAMPTTPISGFAATDTIDLVNIASGSSASATYSSGVLTVSAGSQSYDLTLAGNYAGATFTLDGTGASTEIFLDTGSGFVVSGGQTSSSLVLNSTDRLTVLSGGTALGTTVNIGAIATLSSGGIASGTILHAQGLEQVLAGATVSGTVVSSGGSEALAGTATSTVISLGGTQTVLSGGTAIATAATDHGAQFVSGGTAISTVLTGEAEDVVSAGGVTRYSVLSNDSVETVGSGGLAVSTIVGAPGASIIEGAALYIFSGGTATGAVLSSGFLADAGVTSDTVVLSGGVEYVSAATLSAGGTAIGTVLDAGGTLVVQSGGVITGGVTFNGSGGFLDISGTAMPTTPISGFAATDTIDLVNIASGSSASATYSSGVLTVSAGSQSYDLTLAGNYAGATFTLDGTGASTEIFLDTGSGFVVSGGQTSSSLVLNSTDRLTVLSGGTALGTTVNIGAIATLSSGGIASGTILHAQGLEQVLAGATVSGTVVSSGGSEALAGTATSTVISLGGTQTVLSGGTAIATAATDHGAQFVSGGTAISTVLTGEAEDVVSAGGVTRYSVLSNDSVETVGSGGLAVSTIVGAPGASIIEGAALYVFSGGTATGAVLSSGFLADAGVTSDTVVLSGGVEYVSAATLSAGGTAIGTVLDAGGTLVVQSGGVITGGVTFNGSGGFLDISGTAMPTTPISGFAATDTIDLVNIASGSSASATYSSGVLTVSAGSQSYDFTLAGNYTGATFTLDGTGASTEVFATNVPCFAAGTRIRTDRGEVAVEALVRGDWVLTAGRGPLPIRWIGHRSVDCRRHPRPAAVLPVCIRAHAFAPNLPSRDLFLSPDHAVFAEGALIPVKHLINGDSLAQRPVDRITYFHIELPGHAVIFAEGLPAESYLDTGDRASFSSEGPVRLHPAFGSELQDIALLMDALACAPFRVVGPEVDRVRLALAARLSDAGSNVARTRSTSGPVTRNGA